MAERNAPPSDDQASEIEGAWSNTLAGTAFAFARRFASGGTLWAWSPAWPWHAHHIAAEFVHPVVVGTYALDAVAVPDTIRDPIGWLRTAARPQDMLLVMSTATEPAVGSLMRRAAAWGLTTLWLGAGSAPAPGAADHVLFTGHLPDAVHNGTLVLAYHLLWELTQVCLEHPGLLTAPQTRPESTGADRSAEVTHRPDGSSDVHQRRTIDPVAWCGTGPAPETDFAPVCVTCSNEARLAEVISVHHTEATVRTPAGIEPVDVSLLGPLGPGSLVLVHAGMAIAAVEDLPVSPYPPSGGRSPQ